MYIVLHWLLTLDCLRTSPFITPDGDTGTNMVICFKKAVSRLVISTSAQTNASLVDVTSRFCDDVVMNGQGNSGTILSHYFKTLAVEVKRVGKPGEWV
jgi:dihydroxyacetone kinase-like predicted kinase